MKPQVVVLAGGLGTRLRPITEKIPKPLVAVAGEPFLQWQLTDLAQQGYTKVLLLVGYLGEQIENHFGDGSRWGLELSYVFEAEPLGTGGALVNAYAKLKEQFILLNGDSFLHAPLDVLYADFLKSDVMALVSTYDNRQTTPVIPNLKVEAGKVTAYKKGAGSAEGFSLVDSGIYILKKTLLEQALQARPKKFQLEEFWPALISKRQLAAHAVSERFYDIGTPERLKEFEEKVRDYFKNTVSH